jgi:flagellar motor protein MotB
MPIIVSQRNRVVSVSDDNPYWISFSDIMAGLLVIFILACAVLLLQLLELKDRVQLNVSELHEANKVRKTILEEIADRLKEKGITVEVSDNHTVLRIPDQQLFFTTNSYAIQTIHAKSVNEIGRVLYESILAPERLRYLDTIFVEGHTDSRRANRFPMGNWGLSSFRAISIWKSWTEKTEYGEALKSLHNRDGKPLFSVSGYAASRKLEKLEETDDQRKRNRRIDIRFTTRQPSIENYEGVLTIFNGK